MPREVAINRCADTVMEIIEREVNLWKGEHESQGRQIQQQLAQDKDIALGEAQKAREEAEYYKAEVQKCKDGWGAEVGRLQKEVQSWKNEYELAVKRQNEAQQRLGQTQARFSHTIIPIKDSGMSICSIFSDEPCVGTYDV